MTEPRETRVPIVRRDELDAAVCSVPGCDHSLHPHELHLCATCHPSALLDMKYGDGLLHVRCGECRQLVVCIKVAASRRIIVPHDTVLS